jgi:hypothetical protein
MKLVFIFDNTISFLFHKKNKSETGEVFHRPFLSLVGWPSVEEPQCQTRCVLSWRRAADDDNKSTSLALESKTRGACPTAVPGRWRALALLRHCTRHAVRLLPACSARVRPFQKNSNNIYHIKSSNI